MVDGPLKDFLERQNESISSEFERGDSVRHFHWACSIAKRETIRHVGMEGPNNRLSPANEEAEVFAVNICIRYLHEVR